MTTVTIKSGLWHHRIVAEGHSDPEVCNGISALMFMIAGCALNKAYCIKDAEIKSGYMCLDFKSFKMKADIQALTIGLLQIEKAHPEQIKVIEKK